MNNGVVDTIIEAWCAHFGIENYDLDKTLKDNVIGFDKVDELLAIIIIEDSLGNSMNQDDITKLKESNFQFETLINITNKYAA